IQRNVALDADQFLGLDLEIGQVVERLLLPADRVEQSALVPGPAGEDFGVVPFQDRVDLLDGRGEVAGHLGGVEHEQAFVDVGWHRSLPVLGYGQVGSPRGGCCSPSPSPSFGLGFFLPPPSPSGLLKRFMQASIPWFSLTLTAWA